MPEVTITLAITVPDGSTVSVDTHSVEATLESEVGGYEGGVRWMEDHAPVQRHVLQRRLLERLHERFGLVGSRPSTGSRPYLNFYAEARYGDGRIGALTLNTSRFYAVLDPSYAAEFPGSEPAEGRYLTCYISDESSIDLAIELVRGALASRGWSG